MKTRLGGSPCHKHAPTAAASAIVLWYWSGADINTGAADEDERDLFKM
jgi:hypothetical protein